MLFVIYWNLFGQEMWYYSSHVGALSWIMCHLYHNLNSWQDVCSLSTHVLILHTFVCLYLKIVGSTSFLKKSLCTVWNYEMQWVDCSSFFLFLLLFSSSGNNYWLTVIACWTNILHNSWFQPISHNWLSLSCIPFLEIFCEQLFHCAQSLFEFL